MIRTGFDNDKYLRLQSQKIKERIERFGGKLYLEFGGKLFDDYHASRVLPGFMPDSKIRMLLKTCATRRRSSWSSVPTTSRKTSAGAILASPMIWTSFA